MPASAPIRRLLPSNKITTLKWVCRETGNNYSRHHWDIKVVSVIESVCYIEVLSMSAYFALKIWSRVLGYSAIDLKVYQEIFVRRKKSLKRVIRGYHAYMTTWNALLVNVCNARKNQPTKWTRMQVMWFVLILTGKRRGWWLRATDISMIIFMLLFPPRCTFAIFATGKRVNRRGECGLKIPANFHFCVPEKDIKLTKK